MQKKSWIPTPIKIERSAVKVVPVQPTSKWRGFTITRVMGLIGLKVLMLKLLRRGDKETYALLLREGLEKLGGLWIKVGQLLAMRRDIFGSEAANHLGRLQDSAKGFAWSYAAEIIEKELGAPADELFETIEKEPFSAASIGQIYRAWLKDGTMVAVKVQRPNVAEIMNRDIRFIRLCVKLAVRFEVTPFFRWGDFYYEVQKTLTEELDYRYEATYLRLMRKNLKKHDKMYAPKAFTALSTERVLTMEFVQGALMADFLRLRSQDPEGARAWCAENNVRQDKVAKRLIKSLYRQQYEDNLFHGDLHPGNIVLLRDSRVCLIDFGAVGRYEADFLRKYGMMQEALTAGAFAKAADIFLQSMPDLPPIDLERIKHEMAESLRKWEQRASIETIPYEEKSLASGFGELGLMITKNKIPISWQFLRGDRASYTLDISLRDLFPEMNYFKIMREHQKEAMARRKAFLRKGDRLLNHLIRAGGDAATLAVQAQEEGLYEVEWLRKRARVFRAGPSKLAYLGLLFVNVMVISSTLGLLYLLGLYLYQRHDMSLGWSFFRPMYEQAPLIPGAVWVMLAAMLMLVMRHLYRLFVRFKQPEFDLPG